MKVEASLISRKAWEGEGFEVNKTILIKDALSRRTMTLKYSRKSVGGFYNKGIKMAVIFILARMALGYEQVSTRGYIICHVLTIRFSP